MSQADARTLSRIVGEPRLLPTTDRDTSIRWNNWKGEPVRRILLGVCLLACACGSPSSPSTTPPAIAQVDGQWNVTSRVTGITGGECLSPLLSSAVGSTSTSTMRITQTGASLTAIVTAQDSSTCQYTGTAGPGSYALNFQRCDPDLVRLQCPSGAQRDLVTQSDAINATASGATSSGTDVVIFNVLSAGTSTSVGTLTLNATFTANKQ
jgi:hypothetical protein